MAQKVTVKGFVHTRPADPWDNKNVVDGMNYTFFGFEDAKSMGWVAVSPHTFEFVVPEGFDHRVKAVEALEEKRKEVRAEFQARITEIDAQIAKFKALTMGEPA